MGGRVVLSCLGTTLPLIEETTSNQTGTTVQWWLFFCQRLQVTVYKLPPMDYSSRAFLLNCTDHTTGSENTQSQDIQSMDPMVNAICPGNQYIRDKGKRLRSLLFMPWSASEAAVHRSVPGSGVRQKSPPTMKSQPRVQDQRYSLHERDQP
jgi:hypothetical protein